MLRWICHFDGRSSMSLANYANIADSKCYQNVWLESTLEFWVFYYINHSLNHLRRTSFSKILGYLSYLICMTYIIYS